MIDEWSAVQAADQIYASIDDLAAAWHAREATHTDMPGFRAWQRSNPTLKPHQSGCLRTAQGPQQVTVLLDTGATHCFICARLAATRALLPSGQPGPTSVTTAGAEGTLGLASPVLLHLAFGDTFRESISVLPMDMDVEADLILGWVWISSHDLHHLYGTGRVSLQSCTALLQLDLLRASARPVARTLSVIGHGEFRRPLRQLKPETPALLRPLIPRRVQRRHHHPLSSRLGFAARQDGQGHSTQIMQSLLQLKRRLVERPGLGADRVGPRTRATGASSPTAWSGLKTALSCTLHLFVWLMLSCIWRALMILFLLP